MSCKKEKQRAQKVLKSIKVFTIVVTYNGMEWIPLCLESLSNSGMETGVIIVDNDSTDGTQGWIRSNHPEMTLIELGENVGFARANNRGIRMALDQGAEAVFLLNQDASVEFETIGKLYNAYKSSSGYGIFSPLHLKGDRSALEAGFAVYLQEEWERRGLKSNERARRMDPVALQNGTDRIFSVKFINAAAWMISRDCLQQTGGFCPLFFMYGEDLDYSRRAEAEGFKTAVVPSAQIRHFRIEQEKEKPGWSLQWELDHFERSILLLFLHPSLNLGQRFVRIISLWSRGLRRLIRTEPFSVFYFYKEKTRLFFFVQRQYASLKKSGPWRFLDQ